MGESWSGALSWVGAWACLALLLWVLGPWLGSLALLASVLGAAVVLSGRSGRG